jgi:limonene-1,2-epoxide hydrolase
MGRTSKRYGRDRELKGEAARCAHQSGPRVRSTARHWLSYRTVRKVIERLAFRRLEGVHMSDSPESVVRTFLATWADPKLHELVSFFDDGAVFIDGPRGVHRGVNAIKSELETQLAMGFGGITADVKSLVADGGTVMLERVDSYRIGGKPFSMEVMAAFEIDAEGRIKRWRESYDLKSITDQIEAAGFKVPK